MNFLLLLCFVDSKSKNKMKVLWKNKKIRKLMIIVLEVYFIINRFLCEDNSLMLDE